MPAEYILAPYGTQDDDWSQINDLREFQAHRDWFVRFYNANRGLEHPDWSSGNGMFECSLMYPYRNPSTSSTTRFSFAVHQPGPTFQECCFTSSEEKSLCTSYANRDLQTHSQFTENLRLGTLTVTGTGQKSGPILLWRYRTADGCISIPLPTPAPTPRPTPAPVPRPTPAPTPAPTRCKCLSSSNCQPYSPKYNWQGGNSGCDMTGTMDASGCQNGVRSIDECFSRCGGDCVGVEFDRKDGNCCPKKAVWGTCVGDGLWEGRWKCRSPCEAC